MRILVLELAGVAFERLLLDGEQTALRRLATAGCYGRLEAATWDKSLFAGTFGARVARAGGRVEIPPRAVGSAESQGAALRALKGGGSDYLGLAIGRLAAGSADQGIAQVLELVDDDTALLALLGPSPGSLDGFVLAVPGGRCATGELRGVTVPDLAQTLLDAAGYEAPEPTQGRSLLAKLRPAEDEPPLFEDEEAQQRARLEGLGYLG